MSERPRTITVRVFHHDDNQPTKEGVNPIQMDEFTIPWKNRLVERMSTAKIAAETKTGKKIELSPGPGDVMIATYRTELVRGSERRSLSPRAPKPAPARPVRTLATNR